MLIAILYSSKMATVTLAHIAAHYGGSAQNLAPKLWLLWPVSHYKVLAVIATALLFVTLHR